MPVVAVFDTNVLLSGVGWKGRPYQCLELARAGRVEGVVCRDILDELVEKLESRLRFSADQINGTLADLLSFLDVVPIQNQLHAIPDDPDDDCVLECAMVANATHIVSGDQQHLVPLRAFNGISIVTPAEFIRLFGDAGP